MRSPKERAKDEARVEQALLGQLLPAHDLRIHTKVVGVTRDNPDGSSRQAAIERMHQFDLVELRRNPADEWDRNAIQVLALLEQPGRRKKGELQAAAPETVRIQIGHLEAELAAQLAPAIDRGEKWWAIATRVGGPRTQGCSLLLCRLVAQPAAKPKRRPRKTAANLQA